MSLSFSAEREADPDLIESPPLAIRTFPHIGKLTGIRFRILEYG